MSLNNIIHRHHDGKGTLTFESVQDCTPIVEANRIQRLQGKTGSSEMKLAARFPNVIVERYLNENKITFHEWLGNPEHAKRMMQDPALAAFRVWEGRV